MHYPIIDLHMHTVFSDGTDALDELLEKIRETGIDVFAITDHDEIRGAKEMLEKVRIIDPGFITGVEFSCRDEFGKYHILGYHYDPESADMKAMIGRVRELRMKKAQKRVEWLETEYGFRFPQEDLDELFANNNPGKPHIADMVVKNGYAPDRSTAITEYISPCRFAEYIRPEEAIQAILKGGGIPVLAHGLFGNGDQKNNPLSAHEMEDRIIRLKEMGLQGLECFYSGFSAEQTELMLKFKNQHRLFATAGSDYHGKKKTVQLGNTGEAAAKDQSRVYTELMPFLEECGASFGDPKDWLSDDAQTSFSDILQEAWDREHLK